MSYPRILAAVAGTPWAIDPVRGRAVVGVLASAMRGESRGPEAKLHPARERSVREAPGGVAIIPIHGVMHQHADLLTDVCGGTSTDRVGRQITAAAQDPDIKAIVLHVESPGGSIYGLPELADRIMRARDAKPVIAQADSYAASAAYWAASQATEVVVSPGGDVGSIGVYTVHDDLSGALAQEGVVRSFVAAGEYKVEGHPFAPLADEARAAMQERVDRAYTAFVSAVARGRGRDADEVAERFGQGRMVDAETAVKRGMADRIATLDETLARFLSPRRPGRARAEAWAEQRAHEVRLLEVAELQ